MNINLTCLHIEAGAYQVSLNLKNRKSSGIINRLQLEAVSGALRSFQSYLLFIFNIVYNKSVLGRT